MIGRTNVASVGSAVKKTHVLSLPKTILQNSPFLSLFLLQKSPSLQVSNHLYNFPTKRLRSKRRILFYRLR